MELKSLVWVGSSKEDLLDFPEEVIRAVGYALYLAQRGNRHLHTKILRGFKGAGVIEIIDIRDSGTYRVVYTIKKAEIIFVRQAFQKKSKQGIKTPKKESDLIKKRLNNAYEMYMHMEFLQERVYNEKEN